MPRKIGGTTYTAIIGIGGTARRRISHLKLLMDLPPVFFVRNGSPRCTWGSGGDWGAEEAGREGGAAGFGQYPR